ncbi:MAG: glycosyltransferase family 2 protein [Acidimicrobiales bacterium]
MPDAPLIDLRTGIPLASGDADLDVSVLVPLLDEADTVRSTIEIILDQDYPGSVELLLIDGGSTDGTREIVAEVASRQPGVRLLDNPDRTTPVALNIGLRHARGRFVARIDAHSEYPRHYLRAGVERMERGDVASVSGPALARSDRRWSRRVALALSTWLGTGAARFRSAVDGEVEVDTGFTGVWERSTLEAHGGWDEDTYPNEDAELAARIRAAGGRLVCLPEMAAYYTPRNSLVALARQYWRYGQYRCRTAVRQPNSVRPSHVLSPGLAVAVLLAPLPLPIVSKAAAGGVGCYAAVNLAVSAAQVRGSGRDAVWLPAVFATMHLSWGFGFLRGITRFGFPTAAVRRIVAGLVPGGRRHSRAGSTGRTTRGAAHGEMAR